MIYSVAESGGELEELLNPDFPPEQMQLIADVQNRTDAMDEKGSEDALGVDEDAAETEVADRPRQPVNYAGRVAERTADNMRKPSVLAQLHAKQADRSAEPQKSLKRKSHDMEL